MAALALFTPARAAQDEGGGVLVSGFLAGVSDPVDDVDINLYEAYLACWLPWRRTLHRGQQLRVGLIATGGLIRDNEEDAEIFSGGFLLGLGQPGGRLAGHIGSRAAYLAHDTFDGKDIGGNIQFVSHAGLSLRLWRSLAVGGRIQHMSNAGLDERNGGLNTLAAELSFAF